jgi:hypothetical protein
MKLAAAYLRATYGADQRVVLKVKRYGSATAPIIGCNTNCGFTALSNSFGAVSKASLSSDVKIALYYSWLTRSLQHMQC